MAATPDLAGLLGVEGLRGEVLGWLDTRDATALRGACAVAREAVAGHPWCDMAWESRIRRVACWRACFPRAVGACVRGIQRLRDADFVHLAGLRELDMSYCGAVSDAAFVHLRGIHMLDMSGCNQSTITDAAFVHLRGIHTLYMSLCYQPTITDAAFAHLRGIHTLIMRHCDQRTITDGAFAHLAGIRELHAWGCAPALRPALEELRARGARVVP